MIRRFHSWDSATNWLNSIGCTPGIKYIRTDKYALMWFSRKGNVFFFFQYDDGTAKVERGGD